jgi:hypothetical protein
MTRDEKIIWQAVEWVCAAIAMIALAWSLYELWVLP